MTNKEEIHTLINNYATYADTRQTKAQFDLFTKDGSMSVYYPWNKGKAEEINTSEKMLATFEALKQYEKTVHFIGQVEIALDSEKPRQASAYVYTIAHHVITKENGEKSLMIAYLRYDDSFEKINHYAIDGASISKEEKEQLHQSFIKEYKKISELFRDFFVFFDKALMKLFFFFLAYRSSINRIMINFFKIS